MDCPSKSTSPALGVYSRLTQLNNVVFPAPLGPIRPTIWPGIMSNETDSRATMPPKRIVTSRTASSGVDVSGPIALQAFPGAERAGERTWLDVSVDLVYRECSGPLSTQTHSIVGCMRVGVNLLNFGPGVSAGALADWTQLAETLGYHFAMISDHVAMTPDVVVRYPAP